jgi:hypothetical protein
MTKHEKGKKDEKSSAKTNKHISLAPLEFEEALENLLLVKPAENSDSKKGSQKQKGKAKK